VDGAEFDRIVFLQNNKGVMFITYYYFILQWASIMHIENVVVETEKEVQEQSQESETPSKVSAIKAVLIKKGEYLLSNSFVLPSFDVCLVGEEGTVLIPLQNVLAIIGVGNKDIKCSKCGCMLVMKIKRPQLQNLAIKCPSCGDLNQL